MDAWNIFGPGLFSGAFAVSFKVTGKKKQSSHESYRLKPSSVHPFGPCVVSWDLTFLWTDTFNIIFHEVKHWNITAKKANFIKPCKSLEKKRITPKSWFLVLFHLTFRLQCPKKKNEDAIQGGPLPVISTVITPFIEVTTPVTHWFSAIYRGPKNSIKMTPSLVEKINRRCCWRSWTSQHPWHLGLLEHYPPCNVCSLCKSWI